MIRKFSYFDKLLFSVLGKKIYLFHPSMKFDHINFKNVEWLRGLNEWEQPVENIKDVKVILIRLYDNHAYLVSTSIPYIRVSEEDWSYLLNQLCK